MDVRGSSVFLVMVGLRFMWSPTPLYTILQLPLHLKFSIPGIYGIFGFAIAMHSVPGQAVLDHLQLAGHQGPA